jgi:hypothetical protein
MGLAVDLVGLRLWSIMRAVCLQGWEQPPLRHKNDRNDSVDIMSTDWKQLYRARLPQDLDERGDLALPWERFPTYERYTIGWRMGGGEDWLSLWHVYLEDLDPAYDFRLAYLRRHPPAPVTWADWVHSFLHPARPDEEGKKEGVDAERRAVLLREGVIASDVAYSTWLSQQQGVRWPWTHVETPEDAARYWTREFWFWSRQVDALRNQRGWEPPAVPDQWQACASQLRTGEVRSPDLRNGLLSLAQMLCAGRVVPPWRLGLTFDDFKDSFENDMGYVDAFRLWGMSSFDDREQLQRYLRSTEAPQDWERWTRERFLLFGSE